MKQLLLTLTLAILIIFSCDTTKNNTDQAVVASRASYASPTVQTIKEPIIIKALPADSIPVSYSIKGASMAPADFSPMMGRWISTFDNKEIVQFTPGRYASFYAGEKVVEETMIYYHVCPDNCEGAAELGKPCFVLSSEFGQTCFAIINHTDNELELTMLGSGGVSLAYVRE